MGTEGNERIKGEEEEVLGESRGWEGQVRGGWVGGGVQFPLARAIILSKVCL